MDYQKLYIKFMNEWKKSSPRSRLEGRDPTSKRLGEALYVEVHHITPKAVGGGNELENLVTLLPEEHLFAHKLRYKGFNQRNDMLALRYCLNGMSSKESVRLARSDLRLTKAIMKNYAWIRQQSASFRKKHGWQTADGRSRISTARLGKMPVKDAITGSKIGSIDIDHPKIKSGEWVHHSKGREFGQIERKQISERCMGSSNPNYCPFTDDEILSSAYSYFSNLKQNDECLSISKWIKHSHSKLGMPACYAKCRFSMFTGTGHSRFRQAFLEKFKDFSENDFRLFRSESTRKILSTINQNKYWYSDPLTRRSFIIKSDEEVQDHWIRGRKYGS